MTDLANHPSCDIELSYTVEEIAEIHQRLNAYIARGRELKEQFERAAIAWIKANGRDIRYTINDQGGEMVLTLGHTKSVKCRDPRKTLETMLTQGDFEATANCLASGAWKHGAVKKYLLEIGQEPMFNQLFTTEFKDKLEDGKPAPKELQTINTAFMR